MGSLGSECHAKYAGGRVCPAGSRGSGGRLPGPAESETMSPSSGGRPPRSRSEVVVQKMSSGRSGGTSSESNAASSRGQRRRHSYFFTQVRSRRLFQISRSMKPLKP